MFRTSLDNGLRVVVDARGPAELAAVYLWINVGSADEPPGLEGAAHFVEHLVFKGTRSFGVGEVAAAIEARGGDLNAWTSFDETVFHATLPGADAGEAVRVLAEMLRHARFDPEEVERERDVVVEEIRGSGEEPELVAWEAARALLFPGHPYGRPIIGTPGSVRSMPRAALLEFYGRHYQPANASLVVVGGVEVDAVVEAAGRWLGGGGPRPGRAPRSLGAPTARRRTLRAGFESTVVEVGWPVPGFGHPDTPALDVLLECLGGAASAPIPARLRLRDRSCVEATAQLEAERDGGAALVSLHPKRDRGEVALAAAWEEVARVREHGPGGEDLERARAAILAEGTFGRETVDGRAHAASWYLERTGDPAGWRDYEAKVRAVDAAAVKAAAARWLAPERAVEVALLPGGSPPLRRRGRAASRTKTEGGLRREVLPNGVRLLLQPEDAPVAAARFVGIGGALAETAATVGRSLAWSRVLPQGAGRRGAAAYAAAVERLAGAVGAVSGRSSQAIRAEAPAAGFPGILELALDALLEPRFDAAEVEAVRDELRALRAERDDHPDTRLDEALWRAVMPGHPWALPSLPAESALRRVQPGALRALHARWCVGGNLVVAVTGGFDPDAVAEVLREALGALPPGTAALPPAPVLRTAGRVTVRGGHQARVVLAFPGVAIGDPEQPALEVLAAALSAQAGRLFVELRERHGLAYAVSASSHDGVQQGLFVAGLGCDPERLDEAEARLAGCLARVAAEGLTEAEVDRARRYLLGALAADQQVTSARASSLAYAEAYGLGAEGWLDRARARIRAVDVDAVRAVAARLATPLAVGRVTPRNGGPAAAGE